MYKTPYNNDINRRLSLEDLYGAARKIYNVELVYGMNRPAESGQEPSQLTDGSNCECQDYPIASFKNIVKAWKITHKGGENFRWLTNKLPDQVDMPYIVAVFAMATGYGKPYPEPAGYFSLFVNGEHAVDFTETKYTEKWSRGEFSFCYDVFRYNTAPEGIGLYMDPYIQSARMTSFGIGLLKIPVNKVKPGMSIELEIRTFEYFPSHTWARIDQVHEGLQNENGITLLNWERGMEILCNKKKPLQIGEKFAFFGDIHSHSFCGAASPCDEQRGLDEKKSCTECSLVMGKWSGCGYGTIKNNFLNARDVANADFFCLTDHDFQMNESDWEEHLRIADAFNRDGEFTVLNGYEYTSWYYGHRNIYFPEGAAFLQRAIPYKQGYGSYDEKPPESMYEALDGKSIDYISIPHHSTSVDHPFCWNRFNTARDRAVEIFSGWGNSEDCTGPLRGNGSNKFEHLSAVEALKKGLKFGFVAGSDSHDGFAGNAQGSGLFNWANKFSETGSGRTVAICGKLSRNEIFNAMKNMRTYATTGARILADLNINGHGTGSVFSSKGSREIRLDVKAPGEIEKIHILKNGQLWFREFCDRKEESIILTDKIAERNTDFYHARVFLKDREMAWVTPIWVNR